MAEHDAKVLWTNEDTSVRVIHCAHCGGYSIEVMPHRAALRVGNDLYEFEPEERVMVAMPLADWRAVLNVVVNHAA